MSKQINLPFLVQIKLMQLNKKQNDYLQSLFGPLEKDVSCSQIVNYVLKLLNIDLQIIPNAHDLLSQLILELIHPQGFFQTTKYNYKLFLVVKQNMDYKQNYLLNLAPKINNALEELKIVNSDTIQLNEYLQEIQPQFRGFFKLNSADFENSLFNVNNDYKNLAFIILKIRNISTIPKFVTCQELQIPPIWNDLKFLVRLLKNIEEPSNEGLRYFKKLYGFDFQLGALVDLANSIQRDQNLILQYCQNIPQFQFLGRSKIIVHIQKSEEFKQFTIQFHSNIQLSKSQVLWLYIANSYQSDKIVQPFISKDVKRLVNSLQDFKILDDQTILCLLENQNLFNNYQSLFLRILDQSNDVGDSSFRMQIQNLIGLVNHIGYSNIDLLSYLCKHHIDQDDIIQYFGKLNIEVRNSDSWVTILNEKLACIQLFDEDISINPDLFTLIPALGYRKISLFQCSEYKQQLYALALTLRNSVTEQQLETPLTYKQLKCIHDFVIVDQLQNIHPKLIISKDNLNYYLTILKRHYQQFENANVSLPEVKIDILMTISSEIAQMNTFFEGFQFCWIRVLGLSQIHQNVWNSKEFLPLVSISLYQLEVFQLASKIYNQNVSVERRVRFPLLKNDVQVLLPIITSLQLLNNEQIIQYYQQPDFFEKAKIKLLLTDGKGYKNNSEQKIDVLLKACLSVINVTEIETKIWRWMRYFD